MGETFRKATRTRAATARSQAHQVLQHFLAMFTMGTAIRAITTGRMPLKALSTQGLGDTVHGIRVQGNRARKPGWETE